MKFSLHINLLVISRATQPVAKEISESREPLLITQNGEAKLVVRDVKSYEEREETFALLKILAFENQQIEQGNFGNAEAVFSELDHADFE